MNLHDHPDFDAHESVTCINDQGAGLKAIIAVHNTHLGPALGGCRYFPYGNTAQAMTDVLRLSRGMSYKNALARLPFGGGKSVIIGDPRRDKRDVQFEALGEAVHALNGQYVVAEDSGTTPEDMRIVARKTPFVSGVEDSASGGDPSPSTALGVFKGIKAALAHHCGSESLAGKTVAIQGVGKVGFALARLIRNEGGTVFASDLYAPSLDKAIAELGVIPRTHDDILSQPCDVLAPCAMGGVISATTIPTLNTRIIAGAANNQLGTASDGEALRQRGILYCPDFVVNAGGVIEIQHQRLGSDALTRSKALEIIPANLMQIFANADREHIDTERAAVALAHRILGKPRSNPATQCAA